MAIDPITGSLISAGASALLNAIVSGGKSDQQKEMEKFLRLLEQDKDKIDGMSFSKADIETLTQDIQNLYRGGADVAAGRLGSAIGESGSAGGQAFADLFVQSLAPVIAEGEFKSADAEKWGAQFFANLDQQRKSNLMNFYQLAFGGASALPGTNSGQRTVLGGLQGLKFGGDAYASFMMSDYLGNKDKPKGDGSQ
jgi:hypothetical protein